MGDVYFVDDEEDGFATEERFDRMEQFALAAMPV